jgi:transposase InsO family protein
VVRSADPLTVIRGLLPHRICSAETSWPRSAQSRVWLADITYILTREGFLYLAFILDTHSRRIVGW